MSFAKLTLIGLINYSQTATPYGPGNGLFDLMDLPAGINKDDVINDIIMRGGEFELLYPDYNYMRQFIGVWARKHYRTFERWVYDLSLEYNPLYNYDRHEEYIDIGTNGQTRNGTRSNTVSGSDTINNTGTVTDRTDYNSTETEAKSGNDTATRTDNLTETTSDTTTNNTTQTSKTNGTVTQSKDTKNNQSQTITNTDLGSSVAHSVSAFNASDLLPDTLDTTDGAKTSVTAYNGNADNETTTTSVEYAAGTNGDTVTNTGTVAVDGTKHNTGTEATQTAYNSTISNSHTGNDTATRTDNLTETRTNTVTDSGTDSDTVSGNTRMEHTAHLYGNIGVTQSVDLLLNDLDRAATWNLIQHVGDLFIDEFCIKVY